MNYFKTVIDWNGLADVMANEVLLDHRLPVDETRVFLEIADVMRAGIWRHVENRLMELDAGTREQFCRLLESHTGKNFWHHVNAHVRC